MEKVELNSHDCESWSLPGYRLERLELLNWGTFHGEGQVFAPRGGWSLLVGDNGSGKSTAIDALRTRFDHLTASEAEALTSVASGSWMLEQERIPLQYVENAIMQAFAVAPNSESGETIQLTQEQIAARRRALAELAAHDQEIGI